MLIGHRRDPRTRGQGGVSGIAEIRGVMDCCSILKATRTPLHLLWVRTREDQSGHDEVLRDGSRLVRAHSGLVRTGDQRLGVCGDVGWKGKLGG
jgi:hypothetical protein